MTRSTHLASAAVAALLALPAAALAQSAQPPTAAPPPASAIAPPPSVAAPPPPSVAATSPSAATASPMVAHPVSGANAEQRVEAYIRQLHAQLRITAAEQPQWDSYVAVMRENARDIDAEIAQRMQQFPTMNAPQNLQSYEKLAEAHAQRLQKLVPAFENLYNAMPDQQKQLTDQVFRENAMAHAQRRMQAGSTTGR